MPHQDRLNIAVFVDFDNIEIGVKSTLNEHFDVGPILEAIKERGEIVSKIAYADWTRAGDYSRHLTQHALRLVQRNLTPGGDKNGADINMALDALEMAFTHPHINAYVIVGGDSDFLSLVEKLKQYDKKVFIVGGRQFTSVILQRNCHEFIAYENLTRSRRSSSESKGGRPAPQQASSSAPIAQAVPLVRRALKILSDREVSPQTGLLKSTLLQLDSTFSERNYGASSFLDFAEKLAKEGLVTLKHAGRSVMVELNEGAGDGDAEAQGAAATSAAQPFRAAESDGEGTVAAAQEGEGAHTPAPVQTSESAAEGVARTGEILARATNARWPMYLRNVKQILRQAEGGFDERKYGFGGLMDLLRACQRENLVRIERDRRGGLRVFQGSALQQRAQAARLPQPDVETEIGGTTAIESQPGEPIDASEPIDVEVEAIAPPPELIDTTAELLGRASAKPRRSRAATPRAPRAAAPKGTKKSSTRRGSRAKKAPAAAADSGENE